MSKAKFIEFVKELMKPLDPKEIPEEVVNYFNMLSIEKEKPLFTDNGKIILNYLKTVSYEDAYTSKDIAENLGISTKTISGAIRKLVTDGFVKKVGIDPCSYSITDKGININID